MKRINLFLVTAVMTVCCVSTTESDKQAITSQSNKNFSDITGKELVLVDIHINGKSIGFSREELANEGFKDIFTISFDGQTLAGVGAPNRYSAPYTQGNENDISIKLIRSTMMASFHEPEKLKEHEYFSYLQNVYKWNIVNDTLELHSKTEDGADVLLLFKANP